MTSSDEKSDRQQRISNYRLSDPMIVLVGPMGAGKSTIGQKLAQNMHFDFVDTDQLVEEKAGHPISEIFELEGEEGFRQRETEAMNAVCCLSDTVIATGGGAILSETNRQMMRRGIVIYLHATPDQQFKRIKDRRHRPKLDAHRPLEGLTELMQVRDPLYRAEADFVVNSDGQSVASVVNIIKEYLLSR